MKNFVGEQFGVSDNFGYRKSFLHEKRISRLSVENFLSQRTKKLRNGSLLCFRNFLVWRKFMDKRWRGASRFSVENFLFHSAKKFRERTLQFFRKFWYRSFLHRKGISLFSVEIFCFKVPEKFVRELFCGSKNFGCRQVSCIGR